MCFQELILYVHFVRKDPFSLGDIVVSDTENSRLQVYSPSGQLRNVISGKGDAPHQLNHPMCVALTPDSEERVVVTDSVNAAIKVRVFKYVYKMVNKSKM